MNGDVRLRDVLDLTSKAARGTAQAVAHRGARFRARNPDVPIEQDRFGRSLRMSRIANYTEDQQAERKKSQ